MGRSPLTSITRAMVRTITRFSNSLKARPWSPSFSRHWSSSASSFIRKAAVSRGLCQSPSLTGCQSSNTFRRWPSFSSVHGHTISPSKTSTPIFAAGPRGFIRTEEAAERRPHPQRRKIIARDEHAVDAHGAPGIAERIRILSIERFPRAALSRGVAGVRHKSLIINLPGSTSGVKDGLAALEPIVDHAIAVLRGGRLDHDASPAPART